MLGDTASSESKVGHQQYIIRFVVCNVHCLVHDSIDLGILPLPRVLPLCLPPCYCRQDSVVLQYCYIKRCDCHSKFSLHAAFWEKPHSGASRVGRLMRFTGQA